MPEEIGFKLNVDEGNSQKTVKSFKQELKEAKTEAINLSRQFGELSPQAVAAAKKLGALKDEFADLNTLATNLTDEKKFTAFAGVVSGVAGGFSAVQGAITLATGGSKDFEKAMLKVQAAMAISQGLGQMADFVRTLGVAKAAFLQLSAVQKINTLGTAAASVVQKVFTGAVETTSTGFKVLKGAIISTGIGALVVAVGYLVNNFSELKASLLKTLPFLESISKFIGKIVDSVTDFIGVTSEAGRAADKLREGIEGQNETYGKQIELLEAQGGKAKDVRKIKDEMFQSEIDKLTAISKLNGEASDDDKKKLEDLKFKQIILKAEQAKQDKDEAAEAKKKAEEATKKAVGEAKEKAKKLAEVAAKNLELAEAADEANRNKVYNELKQKNANELELLKLQGKSVIGVREAQIDEEISLLYSSGAASEEAIKTLEYEKVIVAATAKAEAEAKIKELKDERDKQALEVKEQLDADAEEHRIDSQNKELDAVKAKYDAMREAAKGHEELLTEITEREAEARAVVTKKWDEITVQQKKENLTSLAGVLGAASSLFGKNTAAGKVLAIADATIQTYLGATKALSASAGLPFVGTALGIANAAIIVASGIKSVKQIISTKVPGASDGGGGSVPSAASAASSPAVSSAPTMSGIQSTLLDETKKLTEGKDSLKAYVVESEITQKQERQKAITQTANF